MMPVVHDPDSGAPMELQRVTGMEQALVVLQADPCTGRIGEALPCRRPAVHGRGRSP